MTALLAIATTVSARQAEVMLGDGVRARAAEVDKALRQVANDI